MKDLSSNQNNYPPVLPFTLVKISVLQSVLYEEWELKTCVLVRTKILSAISLKYRAKIDRQNEAFGRSARLFLLEICRNYICSKYATFIENSLALRHFFIRFSNFGFHYYAAFGGVDHSVKFEPNWSSEAQETSFSVWKPNKGKFSVFSDIEESDPTS